MRKQGLENIICVKKLVKTSFPAAGNFMLAVGANTFQTRLGLGFFALGMFFLLGLNYLPVAQRQCKHKS